jgi:hypothetical protein
MTSNCKIAITSFTIKICSMVFILVLGLNPVSYAQIEGDRGYEEDEPITLERVSHMLLVGTCIAGVGFLVSQLNFTETFGKIIIGIGGFIGIGGVILYLIQQLLALLSVVLNVGIKIFLFGCAVFVVISVVGGIYRWFTGGN